MFILLNWTYKEQIRPIVTDPQVLTPSMLPPSMNKSTRLNPPTLDYNNFWTSYAIDIFLNLGCSLIYVCFVKFFNSYFQPAPFLVFSSYSIKKNSLILFSFSWVGEAGNGICNGELCENFKDKKHTVIIPTTWRRRKNLQR